MREPANEIGFPAFSKRLFTHHTTCRAIIATTILDEDQYFRRLFYIAIFYFL